jgi:hypothetical protein
MLFPSCDVSMVKRVFAVIFKLLKLNGTVFTVKYLKQCRLLITRYICGRPILVNKNFISSKGGFPNKFKFLRKYIDKGDIEKIKFVLTLMNISRTITPKKGEMIPIDFSSITNPPLKRFKTVSGSFIKIFISEFNLDFKFPIYTVKDFFMNLKQGPHGPSILSCIETIKWLTTRQLQPLSVLLGESFFTKYIGSLYTFVKHNDIQVPNGTSEYSTFDHTSTGRLSIVQDPECKQRVIAISDYFSQFTLKPIHKILMDNLSKFPCDRTYTQDPRHE